MSDVPPLAPAEGQVAQTSPLAPVAGQDVAGENNEPTVTVNDGENNEPTVTVNDGENNEPTGTVNDGEPIPYPPTSSAGRPPAALVFGLLGLPFRDDRKPIYGAVRKVWDGWSFSKDRLTWLEVPEENRLALEAQLRKELDQLFTEPEHHETASKIRRCQEWLPRYLLTEKHRLRRRERKRAM